MDLLYVVPSAVIGPAIGGRWIAAALIAVLVIAALLWLDEEGRKK